MVKPVAEDDSLLYAARKLCQWGWGDQELKEAVGVGRLGLQELDNLSRALSEYQAFWQLDLDEASLRIHGRKAMADGDLGPATNKVILDRRCDVPDRAMSADGEPLFANIPSACRGGYDYYMDWSGYREAQMGLSLAEAKKALIEAFLRWSEIIDLTYRLTEDKSAAKCTADWEPLAGTTLAYSNLANNTCNRGMTQRYDVRKWDFMLLLKTMKHELGHLAGSNHLSGKNIMNPSIRDDVDDFSEYEIGHFRSLGYAAGKPRPTDPTDPTDPTPNKGLTCEVHTTDGKVFFADSIKRLHLLINR